MYRKLAAEAGVPFYLRVPALCSEGSFIEGLAEVVRGALVRAPGLVSRSGERICPGSFGRCPLPAG